ncbi:MAG: hypothetical protein ACE5PM_02205 [Candidatus Hydrothermarchaeales archaeon]
MNLSITALSLPQLLVILAFGAIGGGLKFIDDAFDEDIFDKRIAGGMAPILVVLWIWLSIYDYLSATVLFSILFGVLLTGKIDNIIFKASTAALIIFFAYRGLFGPSLIPLIFLTSMAILDEKGNDYVDENDTSRILEFFFLHRFSMKLGVMALVATYYLPWVYLLAFMCFDVAYDSVGILGRRIVSPSNEITIMLCKDIPQGSPKGSVIFLKNRGLNLEGLLLTSIVLEERSK